MSDVNEWHVLPTDLIELQIGQIDLLMAMYPEQVLDEATQEHLNALRDGTWDASSGIQAPSISLRLQIPITTTVQEESKQKMVLLDLTVPFAYEGDETLLEPPKVRVRVQQSSWMTKAATTRLMEDIPSDEDLLDTIERIKEAAEQHLEQTSNQQMPQDPASKSREPLVRVWFYFPSISTRSKRDDFINHAPAYNLTGFLYAGKPGLLCVEGCSQSIDDYMRFIKTESWGDIPAHHKKVSERYRENIGEKGERVFQNMREITDDVGERRGQRVNRGDMKAVEEWLGQRGLGEAFGKVLM